MLPLLSLVLLLPPALLLSSLPGQAPARPGCGQCQPAVCPPLPPGGCVLGTARDACGCCPVCAPGEGEACGTAGCGAGLECLKSRKRRKGVTGPAGLCVCKSRYPVCGSDGRTYTSGCQLQAASARGREQPPITQLSKGECQQGISAILEICVPFTILCFA